MIFRIFQFRVARAHVGSRGKVIFGVCAAYVVEIILLGTTPRPC
jgi:hypothetical protein